MITAYGLTETCGVVTMCRRDDDPETIATTSGRAIPDVEVRCVDDDGTRGRRAASRARSCVRGYNVMRGYFDDPAETAKAIDADGWLHTGDVGVMDERGYLRITDRIKDMFIVGRLQLLPGRDREPDATGTRASRRWPSIGVPDERMGEVGMAFVVPRPGATLDARRSSIAWCRGDMANYKVPRRVEIVTRSR